MVSVSKGLVDFATLEYTLIFLMTAMASGAENSFFLVLHTMQYPSKLVCIYDGRHPRSCPLNSSPNFRVCVPYWSVRARRQELQKC